MLTQSEHRRGTSDSDRVELEHLRPEPQDMPAVVRRSIVERLPIVLTVELGRANISFRELKNLRKGQVVALERLIGEPLGIFANNQPLAFGEVVSIGQDRYGVRIVSVAEELDPAIDLPS
jgi:flagellar motor switch protein FliN